MKIYNDIVPGIGLGDIKFGMSRDEVKNYLGEPNEIERFSYTETEDDLSETWYYNDHGLSAGFDEADGWRLIVLSVVSENFLFLSEQLMGMSEYELAILLDEHEVDDLEKEEISTEENKSAFLLSSEETGLDFGFEEGRLIEIQWGPLFNEDDTIKWPE